MKLVRKLNPHRRGFTLIECLVYITVLAVILAIGSAAFYRFWDQDKAIRRNIDDIVRTLHAGESWRADLRSASGVIRVETNGTDQTLHIPSASGEIVYAFTDGEVRKQITGGVWNVVLPAVISSQMQIDSRAQVNAWRWEVELPVQKKNAKIRPLFSFEVVPGNSAHP